MPRGTVEIQNTTRESIPRIPFEKMGMDILGKGYSLSLVICADALSRSINKEYRKKDYAPNVLSFPLQKNEGEIFLNVRKAEREARTFGKKPKQHIARLYVHGCFHLKGLTHGANMDAHEQAVLKKFGLA